MDRKRNQTPNLQTKRDAHQFYNRRKREFAELRQDNQGTQKEKNNDRKCQVRQDMRI